VFHSKDRRTIFQSIAAFEERTMGAFDRLFTELAERERTTLAELNRSTKPLREMDEVFKTRLADLVPVRETMPHFDIVERLAAKMALDFAPFEKMLRDHHDAVANISKSLGDVHWQALVESQRQMQETLAKLTANLPGMSSLATERLAFDPDSKPIVPHGFHAAPPPAKLWYGREPGSPKRRIGFVDTNDDV
jgi:hypothetical protein